jgi:signal transduction histidine kinase
MAFQGLYGSSIGDVRQEAAGRLQEFRQASEFPGLIASIEVSDGMADPFHVDAGPPPALTVPAAVAREGGATERFFFASTGVPLGSAPVRVRIVLDQAYIDGTLIPKLHDRYLGRKDELVRSGPWDASLPILSIRPDCLMGQTDRGAVTKRMKTTTVASLLRQPGNCHDVQSAGAWMMYVRARPSLAEATEFARRQNLAISFGVLLVLAAASTVLLISAHRASELAALHKQFAAGVSHELRTPLAIISSASENLADGVVESAEQVRQYGHMIHSHTEQLGDMIENALWFARQDSGRVLDTEELDVEDLVSAAAATCGRMLAEAGVVLEREVEPHLPPIRGNRVLLLHGLQNLLANVALYARTGKWARVRAVRSGDAIQFTIEDRGAGIQPEETERVFQPFYRGKGAKQANVTGLGLGLALVRRIVEAHDGTIELRSNGGVGTAVAFSVPIFERRADDAW